MAALAGAERRAAILETLAWRNRIVSLLRLAVPAIGLLAFLALIGQIIVAGMMGSYGIAGIRIDRGNLVVEAPQYSGASADGARYLVRGSEARTPMNDTSKIALSTATFDYWPKGRPAFHVSADNADIDTDKQTVVIPGMAVFHTDEGMRGTMRKVDFDSGSGDLTATEPVEITFTDGSTLQAADMRHVGATQQWIFRQATLVMPDLPKSNFPPIPFVSGLWVVQ